jgi:hypothetical protein
VWLLCCCDNLGWRWSQLLVEEISEDGVSITSCAPASPAMRLQPHMFAVSADANLVPLEFVNADRLELGVRRARVTVTCVWAFNRNCARACH